jgi:2-keto-3-deoxy-L-rhamnonate aldolase RhmA
MNAPEQPVELKTRLCRGEVLRGLFVATHDATLCEFVATLGWDFLIADAEHAAIDAKDMENIARACERRGATATARVPLSAAADVQRFLDAGARALMVPFVESRVEAERAVALSKYAPVGRRGLAAPRCGGFGAQPAELFVQSENHQTVVIVQIESLRALDNLPEILATSGVDVVFVGPTDLSLALGIPQKWTHPTFRRTVEQIAAATRRAGKVFGAYAGNGEQLSWYESLGARFLATALEDILIDGTQRFRQ